MHRAPRPFRRSLAAVGALALLAGIGACTNDTSPDLGFGNRPLWTAEDVGLESLTGTVLHGDVAVVPGTNYDGGTLAVVDARSGQVRWSADDGDPLAGGDGLVAHHSSPHAPIPPTIQELDNGDWNVLVPYRTRRDQSPVASDGEDQEPTEYGVAALSGGTGRLVWASEPMLSVDDPSGPDPAVRTVDVDRGTVLAAAGGGEQRPLTTWALNAGDGSTQWSAENVWPAALAGGRAIVETADSADLIMREEGPDTEHSSVRALDAASGKPVWDLTDRYTDSTVDVSSGDYVVVRVTIPESERELGDSENETLLLRAGNGKIAERIGSFELCHTDGALIACQPDTELITFRTDTPRPKSETATPFGDTSSWEVLNVFDDTIVVNDRTEDTERVRAINPAGEVIADELIAEPTTLTEEYAVFCKKEQRSCGMYTSEGKRQPKRSERNRPAVDELSLGKALWGREEGGWGNGNVDMSRVTEVALVRDAVLYQGSLRRNYRDTFVVADADDGEPRWTLHEDNGSRTVNGERIQLIVSGYGIPEVAEGAEGWSVLLPYQSSDASGVAALNGQDGKVAWTLPLGEPDDDIDINNVEQGHAAVTVTPDREDARPTSFVLDVAEGERMRRSRDGEIAAIAGDTILVRPATRDGDTLTALDLDDPKQERWTFDGGRDGDGNEDGEPPAVTGVFGTLVIIGTADGTAVLDLASGKELARIGKSLGPCHGGPKLVACDASVETDLRRPASPITLERTESGVRVRELRNVRTTEVNGVYRDRIFLDATDQDGYRSVDRHGNLVDSKLPGRFANANEQGRLLFTSGMVMSDVTWDVVRSK